MLRQRFAELQGCLALCLWAISSLVTQACPTPNLMSSADRCCKQPLPCCSCASRCLLKFSELHCNYNTGVWQAAELAVRAGVEAGGGAALPGMILNTSKKTTYLDAESGEEHSVAAGRMECTMQAGSPSPCLLLAAASKHVPASRVLCFFLFSAYCGCIYVIKAICSGCASCFELQVVIAHLQACAVQCLIAICATVVLPNAS